MIKDVVIIKDGVPIYSRSTSPSSISLFSNKNNLLLLSGFFSALNSFSDQFENFGSIKQLELSKTNLKLSFFKDKSIPNLVFLATYDETSNGVNVQRTLKRLSHTFLKMYNINQILRWNGHTKMFKSFEEIVKKHVEEEQKEQEQEFKGKVIKLFNEIKEKIEPTPEFGQEIAFLEQEFNNLIPKIKGKKLMNPNIYLSDKKASKIFKHMDGQRTIAQISRDLNIDSRKVFNCCKSLLKLNFITLEKSQ
ncbi:MAG: hypothetical protein ACTSXH_12570 [Promethearchaeota archaeon]